ncbi:MAG: DUF4416 family protein [Candidatus Neomarinimicrobiota bacterium]
MDIQETPKVKCIIGIIYSPDSEIKSCIKHLEKVFGPADLISPEYDFDITNYYEKEMGKNLKRCFVSFDKLIDADKLAEIKRVSNIIEMDYAKRDDRSINLDPGYLDMDKLVLASAKYGRQKIYLNKGIYADPCLYFFKKQFYSHEWSFPDFTSGLYNDYFIKVRKAYKDSIKIL